MGINDSKEIQIKDENIPIVSNELKYIIPTDLRKIIGSYITIDTNINDNNLCHMRYLVETFHIKFKFDELVNIIFLLYESDNVESVRWIIKYFKLNKLTSSNIYMLVYWLTLVNIIN